MSRIDHHKYIEGQVGMRGKLTLDKANGKFLGVCAGLGRYFEIDPTMVRLLFVIGTLIGFGSLILVYFAIALLAD